MNLPETADNTEKRPWYKEPMVWLVIAIPASSVIYGTFFLIVSITSFSGMVVDDYYTVGKQINRELKRDKAALAHGLTAQVTIEDKMVTVLLKTNSDYSAPPALEIRFLYSTRADIDKETFVEQVSPGTYKGSIPDLETGRWNVQISSDDWRLVGSMRRPDESKIIVKALTK